MTDGGGPLLSESYNYPFGSLRHQHDPGGDPFDPYYQFTGKERDGESGLQYFEARYYASHLGRFITVDPLYANPDALSVDRALRFQENPHQSNNYCYVLNAPLKYVDPSGLQEVGTADAGPDNDYDNPLQEYARTRECNPV